MSGQESEQVLILLKELSVLKQLDSEYENGSKINSDEDAHRLTKRRRLPLIVIQPR